ncbi:phage baseplate assembly protein V [bacterium]|nr:phage baseplate assembly protein V [bacterium]
MNDLLTRLVVKLKGLVFRAVVRAVDDAKRNQQLRIAQASGAVREKVERFAEYGFASHPKAGAEVVVVHAGGREVVIAVEDARYRLKGLEAGEVALYDDLGSKVHLKRGGIIHVSAETVLLGANAGDGDGVLTAKTLNPLTGLPYGEGAGLGSTKVRAEG